MAQYKTKLLTLEQYLLEADALKVPDWCTISDIIQEACEREKVLSKENYLMDCLDGDNPA